ncbi:MAG: acyl--CoA ligase [Methylococcales symbiont of Hymedesmia sp. n. MRB-2018]|nr:MAG: acyl--CoA ligase [Methylococcales symbiont of Hymedesmia sp. n. MRB-2018]
MTVQLLKTTVQTYPYRAAIIDEQGSISYSELYQQTQLLTQTLKKSGLNPGMGLGVMGSNSRAFIVSMLAGMACGAIVIPMSHQLKQAEIEAIVKDTQLHAVLDDQSGLKPVNNESTLLSFYSQSLRLTWTEIPVSQQITPFKDAAFIRYTSGTTGSSKGVVLTHESILHRVNNAYHSLGLNSEDNVLWVLPMAFHFLVTILVYIRAGAGIIICKDLLAKTLIDQANLHQATMLYAAPMHFRLLAADNSTMQMPSLKYAISTSSAIPTSIANKFEQRFQIPLIQAYGIIEAGLPLLDNTDAADFKTVGYTAKGFDIAILNDKDEPLKNGITGRLAIKGSGLFDAYLKPWQLAEETMVNGWFLTGDLAQRQEDGRIIICGREKTMINVSGNKAFPEEIEAVLNKHPDIINSHVFGHFHSLMGEIVCADIILKENVDLDVEGILYFCRSQLSTYKVPQRLQSVSQINHTVSGKIKR